MYWHWLEGAETYSQPGDGVGLGGRTGAANVLLIAGGADVDGVVHGTCKSDSQFLFFFLFPS